MRSRGLSLSASPSLWLGEIRSLLCAHGNHPTEGGRLVMRELGSDALGRRVGGTSHVQGLAVMDGRQSEPRCPGNKRVD